MIGHDTPFKMPHSMTYIENGYLIANYYKNNKNEKFKW